MDTLVESRTPAQCVSQEPAQVNSPPVASPLTPPAVSQAAETPRPPPAPGRNNVDPFIKAQKKRRNDELRALSQSFGNIPNIPIFTVWDKRQDCCDAAVHRSIMAGICGNGKSGAFSIALSSLYEDDEDGGDIIIYTGAGGREQWTNTFPPKRLRLGPQTKDQSWNHPSNKALITSYLTGNPVRVIRSWKCPSQYAPIKGHRYDGLYRVVAYWSAKGRNGKNVCRCKLERLPDQPPIPLRPPAFSTSRRKRRGRLISPPTCSRPPYNDILDETPNPSESQFTGGNLSQQQGVLDVSAGTDVDMGEADLNEKGDPEYLPPQHGATLNPESLPRYRWDLKKKQLVKVSASRSNCDNLDAGEDDGEEQRGEDDALTLVPSEDSRANMERAETEYFSDRGSPDEPRPSSSSGLNINH